MFKYSNTYMYYEINRQYVFGNSGESQNSSIEKNTNII